MPRVKLKSAKKTYKVLINKIRELSTSLHQPQDIVFARIAKKDDFQAEIVFFTILSCTWYKLVYIPLDSMLYRLYHFHLLLNPWVFLTNRLNRSQLLNACDLRTIDITWIKEKTVAHNFDKIRANPFHIVAMPINTLLKDTWII